MTREWPDQEPNKEPSQEELIEERRRIMRAMGLNYLNAIVWIDLKTGNTMEGDYVGLNDDAKLMVSVENNKLVILDPITTNIAINFDKTN